MRYLHFASLALILIGLGILAVAWIADLGTTWTLVGILVLFTGFIKIGMVFIWTHLAQMGTAGHQPVDELHHAAPQRD